ncbi:hypothetical protein D3C78_1223560 [compost metagenome]
MLAKLVVPDDRRTQNGQQRTEYVAPAQALPTDQVINQRDVKRRQHGKQQEFRHRQVHVSAEAEQVHDAELASPHQHVHQDHFQLDIAPAQERQEHQCRQANAHQHREPAVDLARQIFANQAERERPQNGSNHQKQHDGFILKIHKGRL